MNVTNAIHPRSRPDTARKTNERHDPMGLDIHKIGLSKTVSSILRVAAVHTVRDIVGQTELTLLRWRGLGRSRVNEIKESLHRLGLSLGMDSGPREEADIGKPISMPLPSRNGSPGEGVAWGALRHGHDRIDIAFVVHSRNPESEEFQKIGTVTVDIRYG